ncbi:lipopolysaccharide biosynthesis protein [Kineosporia mesophila]|nr:oligosaccharide flippase family protein [Kineosporia mesophila]MCD5350962.1 oligosaccharide flippase family protein [Kineosporia mesophila]
MKAVTKSGVAGDTVFILLASVVSQAAAAGSYLLLARSVGPEDFGSAIAISGLVLSLVGLAEFGTSNLVTREIAAQKITLADAFHGVLSRSLVMTGAGAGLAIVLDLIEQVTGAEAFMVAILVAGMSLSTGLQGIMRGRRRVRLASWLGASDKLVGLAIVGATLLTGQRTAVLTLLAALSVGPWLVSAYIGVALLSESGTRRLRWVHPYRGSLGFGLTSSVTSVQTVDATAIAWLAGPAAAGQFGAVSKWVAPFNLVVAALSQAALPRLAAARTTSLALRELTHGLWAPALSCIAALITAIASPWVVELLLGSAFAGSASVLSLVALATIPAGASQIALTLLQARGAEGRAARNIVAAVVLQLAAICVGSVLFGAVGSGAAILVTQTMLAGLLIREVRTLLRSERQVPPRMHESVR